MRQRLMYLDQWSPPKEESKQVGHDVITDHNGDRDDEPGKGNFHKVKRRCGNLDHPRAKT